MKKVNLGKILFIGLAFVLTGIFSQVKAGEQGCLNQPGHNVGYCAKNTEGSYACTVNNGYEVDCLHS